MARLEYNVGVLPAGVSTMVIGCNGNGWYTGHYHYFDDVTVSQEAGAVCECDLNNDGRCNMRDWLIFGKSWGRTDCPIQ